jgi:hypothetical protein
MEKTSDKPIALQFVHAFPELGCCLKMMPFGMEVGQPMLWGKLWSVNLETQTNRPLTDGKLCLTAEGALMTVESDELYKDATCLI